MSGDLTEAEVNERMEELLAQHRAEKWNDGPVDPLPFEAVLDARDDKPALEVVRMSAVVAEHVEWLWPGRIPKGKLTILEGDPKTGKSTLSLDIAGRVTTGSPFPDGHRPEVGSVVLLTAEDGLADTVRPRLDAAGADASKVIAWQAVPTVDEHGKLGPPRPPSFPRDVDELERLVTAEEAVLVIVDVLAAYLGSNVDGHRDQDVRRALMPLAKVAERTGSTILVLRHLNKGGGSNALYRGGGSIGIAGAARSILLAALDPDDQTGTNRVLAVSASNLSAPVPSFRYHLAPDEEHGCARIVWDGTSEHTSSSLLAMPASDEERGAVEEACRFLDTLLAAGGVRAKEAFRKASEVGISEKTLRRAKARRGVRSVKDGTGEWFWELPPQGGHEDGQGGQGQEVWPSWPSSG